MLTFEDVGHAYGDRLALAGLSLRVPPGKIQALIGPSGCGKTTTLHLAAGLLRPTRGKLENRFQRTALAFQDPRLLPWRTALDNAAFGLEARGVAKNARRARAAAVLERLGLDQAAQGLPPRALSGGMRQRVGLARALAVDPDLILLDEPFAALDVGLRRELQALLRGLIEAQGLAAVLVTHDVLDALRLADHVAVMAPAPSCIVHRLDMARTAGADPSEAELHEAAASLLRTPAVAAAFRL